MAEAVQEEITSAEHEGPSRELREIGLNCLDSNADEYRQDYSHRRQRAE